MSLQVFRVGGEELVSIFRELGHSIKVFLHKGGGGDPEEQEKERWKHICTCRIVRREGVYIECYHGSMTSDKCTAATQGGQGSLVLI